MSATHEPGDVWHVGWDWYAHMWFVEPPFDVDLDEPIKWFNERSDAFEFVDQWIREQPVQANVIEQMDIPLVDTWDNEGGAVALPDEDENIVVPYVPRDTTVIQPPTPEPVRVPTLAEAQSERERRLAVYNASVGIK